MRTFMWFRFVQVFRFVQILISNNLATSVPYVLNILLSITINLEQGMYFNIITNVSYMDRFF